MFEIASSTEWAFGSFSNSFNPNYFIDIEKNIKNKIKSLKFYKNELRKYPHPRSLKNVENLSMIRGASVGLKMQRLSSVYITYHECSFQG